MVLSTQSKRKATSLGLASLFSLYLLGAFIAEPARTFAATDTSPVYVTVTATMSLTCDNPAPTGLSLGSITTGGDTGDPADTTNSVSCVVITNNSAGYTLAWGITSGSGTANGYNTGHLNSFTSSGAQPESKIIPVGTSNTTPSTTAFSDIGASSTGWGGRLLDDSDCADEDSGCTAGVPAWGTDAAGAYMKVSTGATVTTIAKRTTETDADGDTEYIRFRAAIGSTAVVPTTIYKTTVTFTATAL